MVEDVTIGDTEVSIRGYGLPSQLEYDVAFWEEWDLRGMFLYYVFYVLLFR
jgi:hypothetical protein